MPTNEIVFVGDAPASTISGRLKRGELRALGSGVYTTNLEGPLEEITRKHSLDIAARMFPDAVVTDRSARTGRPVNGVLYLAHDRRRREVELPGLVISARTGAGPLDGDTQMPNGLTLASKGRALAENAQPSRSRGGRERRTLDDVELEAWIDHLCRVEGEARLDRLREQAERLAPLVGTKPSDIANVSRAVGVALGTREAKAMSRALAARRAGRPYDPDRIARFDVLARALQGAPPQSRGIDTRHLERYATLPFYEAYFSNFIEGTRFELEEAEAVVFENVEPKNRSADSHDLRGTYRVVADLDEMGQRIETADEFLEALQRRHRIVLGGRPELGPGEFKSKANKAGDTTFVAPDLVRGTMSEGFARVRDFDTAWERSVYTMFVVAEVHPFSDGNGRVARIMMNGELVAADQSRIIIPTVYRDDYLGALRRLSRQDDPSVFLKTLRYAQDWTSAIDFSDFDRAEEVLTDCNAFLESYDRVTGESNVIRMPERNPDFSLPPAPQGARSRYVMPYTRSDGTAVSGYVKPARRPPV